MDELIQSLQESALPAVWSRGVALTREASFILDPAPGPEKVVRVLLPNRPVHPRVTLWPEEGDAYCDCGDRNDPCLHIVAAALAVKSGIAKAAPAGDSSPQLRSGISYRLIRREKTLELERWIIAAEREAPLTESLVGFVGGIQSGRITHPPIAATKEDFAIDALLTNRLHQARQPAVILERPTWGRLLSLLESAPQILLDGKELRCAGNVFPLKVEIVDENGGFRVRRKREESVAEVFAPGLVLLRGDPGVLRPAQDVSLDAREREWITDGFFSRGDQGKLVSEVIPALQEKLTLEILTERLPQLVDSRPRIAFEIDSSEMDSISVLADLVYGSPPIARVRTDLQQWPLESLTREVPRRDLAEEKRLIREIQSERHLVPGQRVRLTGDEAAKFLRERNPGAIASAEIPRMEFTENGGIQFGASSGQTMLQAWKEGRSYFPVGPGVWAPLPLDWLTRFGDRVLRLLNARKDTDHLPPQALPRHMVPEALELCIELGARYPAHLESLKRSLASADVKSELPSAPLPPDLRAELRHYQKTGIDWLCLLRDHGLGAVLADDMGLGKTLQALCAIRGHTLVICPTSVISAWSTQIRTFRPSLDLCVYHGPLRKLGEKLEASASVTLTTYGILRSDQEELLSQEWDTIILDEAHGIKNPESQVARAAHALASSSGEKCFRLALTGTPVENHLSDLWSLFQFVNPGLLGPRSDFDVEYAATPDRLGKRVRPFLLRRLKRDVAPELPPRTEVLLQCELSTGERKIYEAVLAASRAEVLEKLEQGGSVFAALEALLRLRQACCHAGLIPGNEDTVSSSKLSLLMEKLEESTDAGHRSLVFSQWTSFLDLIEPELQAAGIPFLRLDGQTPDRQRVIEAFQSPSGPPVFLLSLKAGGVGLTLTAADHVYLMDPWWNPAVEDQAADRAHRLGQTQPVLIHRLIALDTVEERILALQSEKRRIADVILTGDPDSSQPRTPRAPSTGLTREDLIGLLG